MSFKKYILIFLFLNLQLLVKAEVPRVNENSINRNIDALEREIVKLRTDNRYLSFKLESLEQKTASLATQIKKINQTINESFLDKILAEATQLKPEKDDLKISLLKCLLQKTGNTQDELQEKSAILNRRDILNDQIGIKNYDQHFNCKNNCDRIENIPSTCAEALAANHSGDGVYKISLPDNDSLKPFYVYCLQDAYSDNDWMIIQRRQGGDTNFARNWTDYVQGFGDLNGDYWLGLERLHAITSGRKHELWIQMKDNAGIGRYASYSDFAIGNETENFQLLSLGNYTGDVEDSLSKNLNGQFSTHDNDNDSELHNNCAQQRMSGWWFRDCLSSLNGLYNSTDYGTGINWIGWHDYYYSLHYVHIAIRPVPEVLVQRTPMVVKPVWIEA